ncbi:MAG: divalent metal cation transporter [Gemmatimonadaceae bacterium]|nr:divalent metal cation transporter [Gemmatimonadaceae bacterium]
MNALQQGGRRSLLLGAVFLMATSAIGPGFLTQTAVFTAQLGASFGFAILVSILLDIGAQLNVWRIIAVSELRAQDIANRVLPGLGHLLAGLVAIGGLAFNVGNVAGAALGLQVLAGVPLRTGAALSAGLAIIIFLRRDATRVMDRVTQVLGLVMIALTAYVAITAGAPVGEAALRSVWPTEVRFLAIVTLVGGTVGGYITFAGGHRLLDAGVKGEQSLPEVDRSAVTGIVLTGIMRVLLFLAALAVVTSGVALAEGNPAAAVFGAAAGEAGFRVFGVVMWAAAITSIIGASYTSTSFIRTLSTAVERHVQRTIILFIATSATIFVAIGNPVKVLVLVGAFNGLLLPLSLGTMLVAAHRRDIIGSYRHPRWLTVAGIIVVVAMSLMAGTALVAVWG